MYKILTYDMCFGASLKHEWHFLPIVSGGEKLSLVLSISAENMLMEDEDVPEVFPGAPSVASAEDLLERVCFTLDLVMAFLRS